MYFYLSPCQEEKKRLCGLVEITLSEQSGFFGLLIYENPICFFLYLSFSGKEVMIFVYLHFSEGISEMCKLS